ncbi:MAG: hypothetical protein K9L64_05395 [Candidatus Izimaplasma sp.]|nr:hypothetical protein [Candidatus Izimaplasma bacterium]
MKRLHLSLIALIGSVVLFIVASFAWFAISQLVDVDWIPSGASSFDVEYTLVESIDGIDYEVVEQISFENISPGDTVYYRMDISNQQDRDVLAEVFMQGFIDKHSDGTIYDSEYSLIDGIYLTTKVEELVIINNQLLTNLLAGETNYETARISITNEFTIGALSSTSIYFQVYIDSSIGNEYQNLGIDIEDIFLALDSVDGS